MVPFHKMDLFFISFHCLYYGINIITLFSFKHYGKTTISHSHEINNTTLGSFIIEKRQLGRKGIKKKKIKWRGQSTEIPEKCWDTSRYAWRYCEIITMMMINLNNRHSSCFFNCKKNKKNKQNIAAPCTEEMHLGHCNMFAFIGSN